jgi:hypothetical protein
MLTNRETNPPTLIKKLAGAAFRRLVRKIQSWLIIFMACSTPVSMVIIIEIIEVCGRRNTPSVIKIAIPEETRLMSSIRAW